MLGSPEPLMSQILCGVPGFWFSQAIALTEHAARTLLGAIPATSSPTMSASRAARLSIRGWLPERNVVGCAPILALTPAVPLSSAGLRRCVGRHWRIAVHRARRPAGRERGQVGLLAHLGQTASCHVADLDRAAAGRTKNGDPVLGAGRDRYRGYGDRI